MCIVHNYVLSSCRLRVQSVPGAVPQHRETGLSTIGFCAVAGYRHSVGRRTGIEPFVVDILARTAALQWRETGLGVTIVTTSLFVHIATYPSISGLPFGSRTRLEISIDVSPEAWR